LQLPEQFQSLPVVLGGVQLVLELLFRGPPLALGEVSQQRLQRP
jgi:hypothetical protein